MKLPLHIDGRGCIRNREGKAVILTQATGHDGRGCLVESSEDLRDKEFIVLACNGYDSLVAALQEAHDFVACLMNLKCDEATDMLTNSGEDVEDRLFDALKLAKGE